VLNRKLSEDPGGSNRLFSWEDLAGQHPHLLVTSFRAEADLHPLVVHRKRPSREENHKLTKGPLSFSHQ